MKKRNDGKNEADTPHQQQQKQQQQQEKSCRSLSLSLSLSLQIPMMIISSVAATLLQPADPGANLHWIVSCERPARPSIRNAERPSHSLLLAFHFLAAEFRTLGYFF